MSNFFMYSEVAAFPKVFVPSFFIVSLSTAPVHQEVNSFQIAEALVRPSCFLNSLQLYIKIVENFRQLLF